MFCCSARKAQAFRPPSQRLAMHAYASRSGQRSVRSTLRSHPPSPWARVCGRPGACPPDAMMRPADHPERPRGLLLAEVGHRSGKVNGSITIGRALVGFAGFRARGSTPPGKLQIGSPLVRAESPSPLSSVTACGGQSWVASCFQTTRNRKRIAMGKHARNAPNRTSCPAPGFGGAAMNPISLASAGDAGCACAGRCQGCGRGRLRMVGLWIEPGEWSAADTRKPAPH